MNAMNAALANQAFETCLEHLRHAQVDAPRSLLVKMAESVTSLFPDGPAMVRAMSDKIGAGAKALADALSHTLRDVAKTFQGASFAQAESAQGAVLEGAIENLYVTNPLVADDHGVIVAAGANGEMKVVRIGNDLNPWGMSAWNPRQAPDAIKKELVQFFLEHPDVAAQEGVRMQEIANGEYMMHLSERLGVTAGTKRLTPNALGDYRVRDMAPKQSNEARKLDPLHRDHNINLRM
jgi:hypothetical protein